MTILMGTSHFLALMQCTSGTSAYHEVRFFVHFERGAKPLCSRFVVDDSVGKT